MRKLYQGFPESGPGYTRGDIVRLAGDLTGSNMGDFFDRYTSGLEPYPFADKVGVLGLELLPGAAARSEDVAYFGINLDSADPPMVSSVLSDGGAYAAGLIAGDTVLAANGVRLRAGAWDRLQKSLSPGDRVRLTVFRYDVLREIDVVASARSTDRPRLRRVTTPTDSQRAAYENWLGQRWPEKDSGVEATVKPAVQTGGGEH